MAPRGHEAEREKPNWTNTHSRPHLSFGQGIAAPPHRTDRRRQDRREIGPKGLWKDMGQQKERERERERECMAL